MWGFWTGFRVGLAITLFAGAVNYVAADSFNPPSGGGGFVPPVAVTGPPGNGTYAGAVGYFGFSGNLLDFVDFVGQLSLDPAYGFGIMNQPVVRDEKRTQSEINAIAMKKTVEFQIDYNQTRVNDLARQLIKKVVPTYVFD